jgi:aspartate racemase
MPQHIGIVGCSAPGAALCYETICTEAPEPRPEVSMHTHPFDQYNRHIDAGNWDGVAELMLSSAEKLAAIGAEFLIAPCNIIHCAFDKVTPRSALPWLHIADELALEARRLECTRVALLRTRVMMESEIYPESLARNGIEVRAPAREEHERLDRFITEEMVYSRFTAEARRYVLDIVERLRGEGCDSVGLCCTELPLLIQQSDTPLRLLDSTRILSRAAIKRALA